MIKDVMITVTGTQGTGDHTEKTEFITGGWYEYRPDRTRITYEESELIGMEGTRTEIEIKDGVVGIVRSGSNNHTLMYEKGKKHIGYYNTPYGDFNIGTTTKEIKLDLHSWGGEIFIDFVSEFNGSVQSLNTTHIQIKERTSQHEQSN